MRRLLLHLALLPLLSGLCYAAPISLFDGKTLDGWDGDPKVWRVEDGAITGGSTTERIVENHFIATRRSFQNFELKLKIKCSGDPKTGLINSGIQIRSVRVPGGSHMSGFQVDCGAGWFGKIYDEFRRNKVIWTPTPEQQPALDKVIATFDWNEYRIRAEGPRIRTWINGVLCIDYTETDQLIALDGQIAPQVHAGGMCLVQFKDVTIEELPPTPNTPTWESLGGVEAALKLVAQAKKPADAAKPQRDISYNKIDGVEALSASEQQQRFGLPEGFEIELVASEETGLPKPVMVAFDDAGRMWSATATMYPCDKDPEIWKQPGKDRVVVFDTPTARTPQTPRVFADNLVMPTSVLPHGKGAFIVQGSEILFLDDRDGDGHADARRVLVQGFGVQDTHTLPHQLAWMPGGRVTFSQGLLNNGRMIDAAGNAFVFNRTLIASMKPDGTDTRILSAGLNNIWAWGHGRTGRVFIHEANDLGFSVVPFEEDSSYPAFVAMKLHPDSPIHPPTAEGLNLGGTGFSGLAICDDTSGTFPAPWQGLLYIANPILGKIHAVSATLDARGVWKFEKRGDLVSCTDPMFRPVALTFGPDGCLYITDWYNRIISHNEIPRDHPARDKDHGRVWRVRHQAQPTHRPLDMTRVPSAELPAHLKAASTWEMRAAWHQIGERKAVELIPALVALIADVKVATDTRIHALWSLEELGHFDTALWKSLLTDESTDLRREAVRAMSTLNVAEDTAFELLQPLADETQWTVRYEVLRFFRRAAGPVNPKHITWLERWSKNPAPKDEVQGWKGPYLALGGSYERAFQDFLLALAKTKSPAAVLTESKWDKVIATAPEPTPEATAQLSARIAAVKPMLKNAHPERGQPLVESICLACHTAGGKGISLAPPLDGSSQRDLDGLLTAILAPDAAIEQVFRLYRIQTQDGGTFEGFKKNESATDITLMLMGGAPQSVPIAKIKAAGYVAGKSVMPPLALGFTDEQLADIVAYLRTIK